MPLLARTIAAPLVVEIGRGAVAAVPDLLRDRRISPGGDVAFLLGPGRGEMVAERLCLAPDDERVFAVRSASVPECEGLAASIRRRNYDAIVGIGGGRTLDVAKWLGTRLGVPTVSVATSLSHDGVASPVSVLELDSRRNSYGVQVPLAVVIDSDFVQQSEPRVTRAGIGDLLSNLSAVADWEMAHDRTGEPKDGLAITMARTAAEAVLHWPATAPDLDLLGGGSLLETLAESLVMSGLAMVVAGSSRPCSGACHEISHALDELGLCPPALHGEQVALGALYATYLRGDEEGFTRLGDAMARFGLPMTPPELGLETTDFVRAVLLAPSTRPERFTILEATHQDPNSVRRSVDGFLKTTARNWPRPTPLAPPPALLSPSPTPTP